MGIEPETPERFTNRAPCPDHHGFFGYMTINEVVIARECYGWYRAVAEEVQQRAQ
jgi:hypothetical protein